MNKMLGSPPSLFFSGFQPDINASIVLMLEVHMVWCRLRLRSSTRATIHSCLWLDQNDRVSYANVSGKNLLISSKRVSDMYLPASGGSSLNSRMLQWICFLHDSYKPVPLWPSEPLRFLAPRPDTLKIFEVECCFQFAPMLRPVLRP